MKLVESGIGVVVAVIMIFALGQGNLKKNVNGHKRFKGLCIHDLCTAAYVTNPELFHSAKYYGDVETKGPLTEGFTMIDCEDILRKSEDEKNIDYIDSVDRDGVIKIFFEALNSYGA